MEAKRRTWGTLWQAKGFVGPDLEATISRDIADLNTALLDCRATLGNEFGDSDLSRLDRAIGSHGQATGKGADMLAPSDLFSEREAA